MLTVILLLSTLPWVSPCLVFWDRCGYRRVGGLVSGAGPGPGGSPRCCLLASMRITSLGGCITGLGSVILLGGYGSQDPLGMGPNMGTTQGYVHISIT